MASMAITNISELTTNDASFSGDPMGRLHDVGVVFDGGVVCWIGPSDETPAADVGITAARMTGRPARAGGGILRTVASTRAASTDELIERSRQLRAEMLASGTTTIEAKSGYDLTVDGERRLLEISSSVADEVTYLGAHAVPREFAGRREDYVGLVAGAMLDRCRAAAQWADAFCDVGAFSVDESREVLLAARRAGLGLRLHGNQLAHSGGIRLAVELGVASVDHCSHISSDDVERLSNSDVVATLLPSADFCTRSAYPDARALLDAGVTVALASDCNPGTSFVTSMPFVVALAVREMHMTPDEALFAATAGGAAALHRAGCGTLGLGATGDAVVLAAPTSMHLAYRPGSNLVSTVIAAGEVVVAPPSGPGT